MKSLIVILLYLVPAQPKKLDDVHISVVTAELSTVFSPTVDKSGQATFTGVGFHLLEWLSHRLGFKYDLNIRKNFDFGERLANGSYTGLFGNIQRKEYEVAISAFGYMQDVHLGDMSSYWVQYEFTMLIPYPVEQEKTWAALWPFKLVVWLLILLAFVCMNCAFIGGTQLRLHFSSGERYFSSWSYPIMYLTGIVTAQGGNLVYKGRSLLLLAGTWCLFAFVVVNVYSSVLVSFLSTTKLIAVADSLQELAEKVDNERFAIFKNSGPDNFLRQAQDGYLKKLGDSLVARPEDRKPDQVDCMNETLYHGKICITGVAGIEVFISEVLEKTKKCPVTRAKERFFPILTIFMFQKNWTYTDIINQEILWANAMGLSQMWRDTTINRPLRCLERTASQASNKPLTIKELSSAFIILVIGILASFIGFLVERILGHIKK